MTPSADLVGLADLLPCPFCGGNSRIYRESDMDGFGQFLSVRCHTCGCQSQPQYAGNGNDCPLTYQEVRDKWNTRAELRALAGAEVGGWRKTGDPLNGYCGAIVERHIHGTYRISHSNQVDPASEWKSYTGKVQSGSAMALEYGYVEWMPLETPPPGSGRGGVK